VWHAVSVAVNYGELVTVVFLVLIFSLLLYSLSFNQFDVFTTGDCKADALR